MRSAHYSTPAAHMGLHVDDLPGRDARWIQRAIGVALTSPHNVQMGALAVSGGSPLGHGVNRYRNHPRIADWENCSTHAEQSLIRSCDASGAHVYVARIAANGEPALAKPCKMCLRALTEAGVKRVIWTADNSRVEWMTLG